MMDLAFWVILMGSLFSEGSVIDLGVRVSVVQETDQVIDSFDLFFVACEGAVPIFINATSDANGDRDVIEIS